MVIQNVMLKNDSKLDKIDIDSVTCIYVVNFYLKKIYNKVFVTPKCKN